MTRRFGDDARFDEMLSRHAALRIGGPADALVLPRSMERLSVLLRFIRENGIPMIVIGGGTNLLVSDDGFRGIVVAVKRGVDHLSETVQSDGSPLWTVGAGLRLPSLCRRSLDAGLDGLSFATGIPGTVGGAVRMNAGTGRGAMGDRLRAVTFLMADGATRRLERSELRFGYRGFSWSGAVSSEEGDGSGVPVIVSAELSLTRHPEPEALREDARAVMARRKAAQPYHLPNAGCFFKNPPEGPGAGALIDRAGLKGVNVGGASVSTLHANFLVNRGRASASDMLKLADTVRDRVFQRFGVILEREVRVIGQ